MSVYCQVAKMVPGTFRVVMVHFLFMSWLQLGHLGSHRIVTWRQCEAKRRVSGNCQLAQWDREHRALGTICQVCCDVGWISLGELHQILPCTPFLSEGADSVCASKIASLKTIKSRVLILLIFHLKSIFFNTQFPSTAISYL